MPTKLLQLDAKRRDAILNAALKEFVRKGFDHASTNIIASEAGISKALLFHYVNSKQELFLFVYDYFTDLLDNHYFAKINFSEKDLFCRLQQSYLLQIQLMKRYPWIFEFSKLSIKSNEINNAIQTKAEQKKSSCSKQLFDNIDVSKFREDLDVGTCKQFILLANIGFTNQLLADIRSSEASLEEERIISILDHYFDELRKVFYKPIFK